MGCSIDHPHEIQAIGWCHGVGLHACGILEERLEPRNRLTAASDVDEAADDEADHFVKEAFAFEFDLERVGGLDDIDAMERAHDIVRILAALDVGDVAAIGGEAGEIVPTDELRGAVTDGGDIDRAMHVPRAADFKG